MAKHGFMRRKQMQIGDCAHAQVPKGKRAGIYVGRVTVRASGSFNIRTLHHIVPGIYAHYCTLLQRADEYGSIFQPKPTETALSSHT